MENNTILNISGRALLRNVLLLYGFGAFGQLIPYIFNTYRRGFFCDDDSIRYPYKTETVTTGLLITYSILINAVVVAIVEFYRVRRVENDVDHPQYRWKNSSIHSLFVRFITYFGYSQIGFICSNTITNVSKIVIGRLRPHFLDVCKPGNETCVTKEHIFITNYTCTGSPVLEFDARRSFYSGHASTAMYAAVWTAIYLQARFLPVCKTRIIVPIVQTLVIAASLAISFSRINDHMHHWSDVLVGVLFGSFFAIYTCVVWAGMFESENTKRETLLPSRQSSIHYGIENPQVETCLEEPTA